MSGNLYLDGKIVNGSTYVGMIDWYSPRFDGKRSQGSIVVQMTPGGNSYDYYKSFGFFDCDIEEPKRYVEAIPSFDYTDIVLFTAQVDQVGCIARNVKYLGKLTNPDVKRMWNDQLHEFKDESDSWPSLWANYHHHHSSPAKVKLKLRYRPKEKI